MTTVDVGPYRLRFTSEKGVSDQMPGFDSTDDMIKVKSIQKKFRDSFTQPLTVNWDVVQSGGSTAAVSGGVLTTTSGVTAGGYVELLSKETFTIPFRSLFAALVNSGKQNGVHLLFEAVSVDPLTGIPNGNHSLSINLGGAASSVATQMIYGVQNGGLAPLTTQGTVPNVSSTGLYELEPFSDECYFHARSMDSTAGRVNSYVRHQQIPDPNGVYRLRIRTMNHQAFRLISGVAAGPGNVIRITSNAHGYTGTPTVWVEYLNGVTNNGSEVRGNYAATVIDANTLDLNGTVFGGSYVAGSGLVALAAAPGGSQIMTVQFINCQDYAELTAEVTAGRGNSVAGQSLGVVLTGSTNTAATAIGQVQAVGPVLHDGARGTTAPLITSGRALSAAYTTVSTGDVADFITTLQGVQIVRPWQIPELEWSYASAAGGIINTTDVVLAAAAGAGLRRYLNSMQLSNNSATATEVVVKDGATVIWRGQLPANAINFNIHFDNPIKTTANAALNFACITTGAAVYVNAQGYIAP